jgi:thymidylate synthase (FAD)
MQSDPALKVANSARISYNKAKESFDESDKKLTSFLWKEEHTSPYRHSYFTFHIKLPLFVARQLMKYQVGSGFRTYEVEGKEVSLEVFDHFYDTDKGCSWNEISGRYTQTSEDFYIPNELRSNPPHGNKQSSSEYVNPLSSHDINFIGEQETLWAMELACDEALKLYRRLIRNGVAKEIARMILPQNIFTECYWTVSLQGAIHFLRQRCRPESQAEIRMLAEGIFTLLEPTLTKVGITKENI